LIFNTISDWVSNTCKLNTPLYDALQKEVLARNRRVVEIIFQCETGISNFPSVIWTVLPDRVNLPENVPVICPPVDEEITTVTPAA
jgi:hypothetical protein